jgi:hypothetical protein
MSDVTVLVDVIQPGAPEAPAQLALLVYEELRLCAVRYTQPLARRADRRPSISRAKDRRRLLPSRL